MLVHTLFWNVQPTMAPTPHRIAQTTSEVKKQYKKNGARIPERQLKQLERAHELDQRAARCRDADERRKAAKKKRDEREEKEQRARRQIGVGLATQLIGYSHTQAQLKNGMEAFLGVKQRKDNEQRRKNLELTKKLETIAQDLEKEPWDDSLRQRFCSSTRAACALKTCRPRCTLGLKFLSPDLFFCFAVLFPASLS